jgi:YfiH family protein
MRSSAKVFDAESVEIFSESEDFTFFSKKLKSMNVVHGFFTKNFKDEETEHRGKNLNTAFNKLDSDDVVIKNREILEKRFCKREFKSFFARQVHSDIVVTIKAGEFPHHLEMPTCDALVTAGRNILIGVSTADCVPVLLFDKNVIGAAHCGWRGLQQELIKKTINEMKKNGATEITAAIGPCIHQDSYFVGEDFVKNFPNDQDAFQRKGDILYFDLRKVAKKQLEESSIVEEIDDVNINTYEREDLFLSYRRFLERGEELPGAQASVISLRDS